MCFVFLWYLNIKDNLKQEELLKAGKTLPSNKKVLSSLFDGHFDKTLLAIPVSGVFLFTVVPIIFMICIAFTNYDDKHQAPTNLFTWVGLDNFKNLLSFGTQGMAPTFFKVLAWTLVWAFFATFIDYFLGLAVAILINKKEVKL